MSEEKKPQKLILKSNLCPGDILTMTAAVYSLHITYPNEYLTDVRTSTPDIWKYNPHITQIADGDPEARVIEMHYPSIQRSNQEAVTFLTGYTAYLGEQLGRPLYCKTNRPLLYLSEEEMRQNPVAEFFKGQPVPPVWLLVAGTKQDYTAKQWPLEHYQEVIDRTRGWVQWVQIGAEEHHHPQLHGVIDMRGKTDHRQMIRLAWHASGGLGPSTYLQHLMAAWQRPYILLLGGREPVLWQQYPLQATLHTLGQLPCCAQKSCWKSRVVPLGDKNEKDKSLCERPVLGWSKPFAECMGRIIPEEVVLILRRILWK